MAAVQPGHELWQRSQIDLRAPAHRPNSGMAESLADAKAAFRRAWEHTGISSGECRQIVELGHGFGALAIDVVVSVLCN
jgi:hypothetical protein